MTIWTQLLIVFAIFGACIGSVTAAAKHCTKHSSGEEVVGILVGGSLAGLVRGVTLICTIRGGAAFFAPWGWW